jgi:hypothetical protein
MVPIRGNVDHKHDKILSNPHCGIAKESQMERVS